MAASFNQLTENDFRSGESRLHSANVAGGDKARPGPARPSLAAAAAGVIEPQVGGQMGAQTGASQRAEALRHTSSSTCIAFDVPLAPFGVSCLSLCLRLFLSLLFFFFHSARGSRR